MTRLRVLLSQAADFFYRKDARRRAFDEELESHLQLHIDDNIRAGMTPEEARRDALVRLGGVEATRQAYRDQSTLLALEGLLQDVRFALRQLAGQPTLAGTAVLVLALGIGAATALAGLVDAALIEPLPYRAPERLVSVTASTREFPHGQLSYADYLDWKAQNTVFESLEVYNRTGFILAATDGPAPASGARVSAGFFGTLGVTPALGRTFATGEDHPGAGRVVVLSYGAWQTRFGASPSVLGRTLTLSDQPYTIVGVLPRDFHFAPLGRAEFWVPLQPVGNCERRRSCHNLRGVARLREGVTLERAAAAMQVVAARLERQYPDSNKGQGASSIPLAELIVGDVRPTLLVLLGGAGLLLVIALMNVASLLLVRGQRRTREIGIRFALGATKGRVLRQFFTEALVLVAAGGCLGLLVGTWTMSTLTAMVPEDMRAGLPFLETAGVNARVLAGVAITAVLAIALFTFAPVLRFRRVDPGPPLATGGRGASPTDWQRAGARFVVLELATAMVLLTGAGLLGRSLHRLVTVELHFDPARLATVQVALPPSGSQDRERLVALARDVLDRVAALPGVEAVALTSVLPVSFNGNTDWIRFVGRPYHGEHNEVNLRDISPAYFRTIGARLLRGRHFTDQDGRGEKVVIINETLARMYFGDEDPIGRRIGDTALSPASIKEIVGIVEDIREGPLDAPIWPAVYYPFNQGPDDGFAVVVRTSQPPESILSGLRAAIRGVHPGILVFDETTFARRIAQSPAAQLGRSAVWSIGAFAGLALLLGVVGLYGVVAYATATRTREIAIRLALGAQRRSIYAMVLRDGGRLTLLGIVIGLLLATPLASTMRGLLFQTAPWDLPALLGTATVLGISAVAATVVPARRAAAVPPVDALRGD